jgi:hypothetical protein
MINHQEKHIEPQFTVQGVWMGLVSYIVVGLIIATVFV